MVSAAAGREGVTIGALGHPGRAVVDPDGRIAPLGALWSVEWWVHVSGRWLLPGRGLVARQSLLGHAPVVETCVRTPAGDVAAIAYGVPGGRAVLDVVNRTSVPIAVAVVVSPSTAAAGGAIGWDGAGTVEVDGAVAVRFSRPPAHAAAVPCGADPSEHLGADRRPWHPMGGGEPAADAAFVFPLARGGALRAAVALAATTGGGTGEAPLPGGPDAVVRGWDRVVAAGLAVDVPSSRLAAAVEVSRRRLLLAHDGGTDHAGAATAARWGLVRAEPAPRADAAVGDASALQFVDWALGVASDTWTWPAIVDPSRRLPPGDGDDAHLAAALLDAVRDLLVREDDDGLVLCPVWPPAWGRAPLDVHRAPTRAGLLSFAVRWHGERPALLWELDGPGTRLTAPGLDRTWVGGGARGEALLSPMPGPAALGGGAAGGAAVVGPDRADPVPPSIS